MNENVSVFEDYGSLRTGCLYKIISEEYDYYNIKCLGKIIQVPKNLINFHPKKEQKTKYDIEEENFADYLDDYDMDGV